MNTLIVIALLFLFACQTRQEQKMTNDPVKLSNAPQAFLASQDTLWLQLCDSAATHLFFKKVKMGRTGQWFAGLFVEDTMASCLWQQEEDRWKLIDTISVKSFFYTDMRNCQLEMPRLDVIDFNEDGYEDLYIPESTNMNGNVWQTIYLYDTIQKTLRRIEGLENVLNVRYDRNSGIIWSETDRSVWGISERSFYQLRGFRAYPLKKAEQDYTSANVGIQTLRLYKGKDSKWELIKEVELNEDDETKFLKEYESLHR